MKKEFVLFTNEPINAVSEQNVAPFHSRMCDFLATLCNSGEKASAIAIELKKCLSSDLIESKIGARKNELAKADFKTFADVLIQLVITRDIEKQHAALVGRIYGEECNEISVDGKSTQIEISEPETTLKLLQTVLGPAFDQTSKRICAIIHDDAKWWTAQDFPDFILDISKIAVWVDPIDATSQYIKGKLDG